MEVAEFYNLMTINGIDPYAVYRVWLFEKKGEQSNIDALMKPAPVKVNAGINIREVKGRKYSADLLPVTDERDFTLYFAVHGDNNADFLSNYAGFIDFLKKGTDGKGWLTLQLTNIPGYTFRCFVKDASGYEAKTYMDEYDVVVACFKIVFTEPAPNF